MKFRKEVSAGGIVFKKLKSDVVWLITQHSKHKGWGFPKGIVAEKDSSETMEEAALREVEEEGGVKAKIVRDEPFEIHYKYRSQSRDTLVDKTVYFFLMEYVSGDPKDHDWEMADAKFVATEEVRDMLSFKTEQQAFESVLQSR